MRVILAPEPCNFHRTVVKKLQKRVAPFILLCSKKMPDLSTNTYSLELCVSSLHKGPCKISLRKKKKQRATDSCRRENRHSCEGSPTLCGRLFRDIRTFGRAAEGSNVSPLTDTMGGLSGCRRGGDTSEVCSTPSLIICRLRARALTLDLGCGTCCPPFVIRKAYTIKGSSTPRHKSSAMCRLHCSTRCARRSTSLASVLRASMFSLEVAFLQLQCCFQRSLQRESDLVQAEHDTRPAFLALDFLARLRSTVPYVRRQLHWCALHHVALPVRLQHHHVFWCQPPRRRQIAQERHPHARTGTELLLGVCALCFGLALDCASGFVVDSTRLCHCFGHALRAWNQIRLEHGGSRLSQFCRDDQRQSRQHVHQAPSDVSVVSCHRLSHRSTALPLRSLLRLALAPRRHLEIRHF